MNKKTIIFALIMVFSITSYVMAEEANNDHEHGKMMIEENEDPMTGHDDMDSMQGDEQMGSMIGEMDEEGAPVIEVGNSVCPVSGEKVGTMGPVVKYEYKGKIYNLCCEGCVSSFKKDPEKYVAIVEKNMVAEGSVEEKDEHMGSGHQMQESDK